MRKIILGLAPALMLMSGTALAAQEWKVSEVSGTVRLTENGKSRPASRGALLSSGAMITTGPAARAVIVRGEEFVVISPSTQIRVPAAVAPNKIFQLIEDFGTAIFKITKKSTPHFGVQTPYLAAVVKGTTFTVTVGEQGGSVQVTEGAVEVSTLDGGAADLVTPGTIAQVGASDLYRLTLEGALNKEHRSVNGPRGGTVSVKSPRAQYAGPKGATVKLSKVSEDAKELDKLTKGLVHGKSGEDHAFNAFHGQSRDEKRARRGDKPGKGPKPDGDDDDKGGGNDKPPKEPKPDKPDEPTDEPVDEPTDEPKEPKGPKEPKTPKEPKEPKLPKDKPDCGGPC